jgi:hypothetical protein
MTAVVDIDAEIDIARRILKEQRALTGEEHRRVADLLGQAARIDPDGAVVLASVYRRIDDNAFNAAATASARATATAMASAFRSREEARRAAWLSLTPERKALHAVGDGFGRTSSIFRAFEKFVGLIEMPVDDPPQGFEP